MVLKDFAEKDRWTFVATKSVHKTLLQISNEDFCTTCFGVVVFVNTCYRVSYFRRWDKVLMVFELSSQTRSWNFDLYVFFVPLTERYGFDTSCQSVCLMDWCWYTLTHEKWIKNCLKYLSKDKIVTRNFVQDSKLNCIH